MRKKINKQVNKKQYTFSIIMSVYNVEKYIEEAIESLINQTFPFEKVQLIIVNDGSKDNSKEICLKYKKLYNNIEYYEKENGGIASARNLGLNYVKGKYINFLDPDDTITEKALEKVNIFSENHDNINLVGLVVKYFENKDGIHPRYLKFERETTIVDLEESPQNYILSSAATFYRSSIFKDKRFDENLKVAEDLYLNCQIYLENNIFGIISLNEAVYNYRIRKTNTSLTNNYKYDIDSFIQVIKLLHNNFKRILEEKNMEMPEFLKYILLGELVKKNKALNCSNKEKLKDFYDIAKEILNDITPETIRKFDHQNHMVKIALLTIKYDWNPEQIEYKIIDNRLYANAVKVGVINECPLILSKLYFKDDLLKIEAVYNDIMPINNNINFRFKDENLNTYNMEIQQTDNEFYLNKTLGMNFNKVYSIKCSLPLNNLVYKPCLKIAGEDIKLKFNNFYKFGVFENFISDLEPFNLFNKKKVLNITNYSLDIKNKKIWSKFLYNIRKSKYLHNNYYNNNLYRKFNRKNKKYILINDRPMVANDNGQAMFEYICKNQKKLSKNTYFVLSKKSKDFEKLKKIGKVVDIGSEKHKKLFINSKIIISSHANFYNPFNELETKINRDIFDYKLVFLQHGVIINNVHKPLNKPKSGIDLFVTSTEKERMEILSNKYMYEPNNVILTGLPRFDKLNNKNEKLIVIAPTWRTFLSGPINPNGFHDPIEGFENSDYFKKWSSIISNKKLLDKCKKEEYKILFILHPGFRNYYKFFESYNNDIVKVEYSENINYSNIFSSLSLLITDYSSIMFDVAYLKKPIIFYQFDKDLYFTKHYKPGYFSYENDGFGKVVTTSKEVLESIFYYFGNDFKLEKQYTERINSTFKYIDKNNCKRVLEHIIKMSK